MPEGGIIPSNGPFLSLAPFLEQRAAFDAFNFNLSMWDESNLTVNAVGIATLFETATSFANSQILGVAAQRAITEMRKDLDRERTFMLKQWSKRESQLLGVLGSTTGLYGDLQGIAGQALPEIENLEMPLLEALPPNTD